MATIQGLTKDRMLEIEAASIISATVDSANHLILTKHDLSTIDAGLINSLNRTPVKNSTGSTLTKGTVVYVSGANGTNVLVSKSKADAESTSSKTLGFIENDIYNGDTGYVVSEGFLSGLNTSTANAGDSIWLSPTTAGSVVYGISNKPVAPNHMVYLGIVLRSNTNTGEIYVKIQNGFELEELHDVSITSATAGDVIVRNALNTMWVNNTTIAPSKITGTAVTTGDTRLTSADAAYRQQSTTSIDTINREYVTGTFKPATANLYLTGFTPNKTFTTGTFSLVVTATGTSITSSTIAVYEVTGTTLTLRTSIADTTIGGTAGLITKGASPVTFSAGTRYAIGIHVVSTVNTPTFAAAPINSAAAALTPVLTYGGSQATVPSSVAISSLTTPPASMMFFRIGS